MILFLSGSLSLVEHSIALYFLERLNRIKPIIFLAAGMACALYFINPDGVTNPNANALHAMVSS